MVKPCPAMPVPVFEHPYAAFVHLIAKNELIHTQACCDTASVSSHRSGLIAYPQADIQGVEGRPALSALACKNAVHEPGLFDHVGKQIKGKVTICVPCSPSLRWGG